MTERITDRDFPILGSWIFRAGLNDLFVFVLMSAFLIWIGTTQGFFLDFANESFVEFDLMGFIIRFFPIIFPGFYLLAYIKKLIYAFLWRRNFHYEIGERDINVSFGVIDKAARTTPYESLQGVEVVRDLIDRFFGSATVKVSSAAANSLFDVERYQVRKGLPLLGSYGGVIYLSGLSLSGAERVRDVVLQKMKENPARKTSGL